jgi:hypothetical protein
MSVLRDGYRSQPSVPTLEMQGKLGLFLSAAKA